MDVVNPATDPEPGLCLDEPEPFVIQPQPTQGDITTWAKEVKALTDNVRTMLAAFDTCGLCGACVLDQDAHTKWHKDVQDHVHRLPV